MLCICMTNKMWYIPKNEMWYACMANKISFIYLTNKMWYTMYMLDKYNVEYMYDK